MTPINDISNQNINNAGAELAGGGEVKPFVPDELWDERMRMMSAMPIEAVDAWTKAAKQVIELKVQLAARDALIERLAEAGKRLGKLALILDSLPANRYVDNFDAIVAEWQANPPKNYRDRDNA